MNIHFYFLIWFKTPFILATSLILIINGCKMHNRKYSSEWNDLFSNKKQFQTYADNNKGIVELRDLKLDFHDLSNIQLKRLSIANCSLSNFNLKHSSIENLIIKNSAITKFYMGFSNVGRIDIHGSELSNVTIGSKHVNKMLVSNSSLVESHFQVESDTISLLDSYLDDAWFVRSKTQKMEIVGSKFSKKEESPFGSMTIGSLLIKDSFLNVEFQESKIKTTMLENITGHWAGFARLKGDTFVIKDSDLYALSLGGAASELKHFESSNSSFEELSFRNVKHSGKVIIKNCPKTSGFIFTKALLKKVSFESCNFDRVRFDKSTVDEIVFSNVQLYSPYARFDGKWDLMDVNTFTLDNVFIQGHFNMEDARIGKLVKKNLRKSENLEINYKGANFKL